MLGKRMSLEAIADKLNRGEGSNDSRHEPVDSRICSEGIRFLEAARSLAPAFSQSRNGATGQRVRRRSAQSGRGGWTVE